MKDELSEVILWHSKTYPCMRPADYVKLLYQNEFGCSHFLKEGPYRCIERLLEEFDSLPAERETAAAVPRMEPIGNGLCRAFLEPGPRMKAFLPLLNLMCFSTAAVYSGSQMRLQRKLELLRQMAAEGLLRVGRGEMESFLGRYAASGCGPVGHSCEYKRAYHPHYRVVRKAYSVFLPVLWAAMKLRDSAGGKERKRPGILAVDGCCGSGKTFLSGLLAEVFHCSVFHIDDFYLPPERRSDRWRAEPAGNIDRKRFLREVLIPLTNGEKVLYRPYSCRKRAMLPTVEIPPARFAVVEGSYSMHPDFRRYYDFRVFLTCLANVQQRRIFLRGDGKRLEEYLECWIPAEERYFNSMRVGEACDLVLDTSQFDDFS